MILNFEHHENPKSNSTPIIFIHGLFGSLSNLGMLARSYFETHDVIQVDVRNHGKSGHATDMNYAVMAQDLVETLDSLKIEKFSLVGHSMGGKIAMYLAQQHPNRIEKLAILDIVPFAYTQNHHDQIFKALIAVEQVTLSTRSEVIALMKQYIQEEMVIQFLLKSWHKGQWLFNVNALYTHYADIISWPTSTVFTGPTLFLKGEKSPYIEKDEHFEAIRTQFPNADIQNIAEAGHWLHAEQTTAVLNTLNSFLK
ncbi:alpha/beta fold hydrolase [Acinetobacter cumulans]|uniref:alpha/beta fold hydrolase n=1 Tax=Acinetobacter cumulans TaxID=2136182 RepID=UPI000D1246C6|nr:alpha/beta fold hydrolase [Acinetobacter cumulans]QCO22100.1 alpha/beta fold hydrolase [Acinetobacter cumulans]